MDDDTFINFACPNCGAQLDYLAELAGSAQPCPGCGQEIVVPAQQGQDARVLPLTFTTPRLLLRLLDPLLDEAELQELLSDPEQYRYRPRSLWTETENAVQSFVQKAAGERLTGQEGCLTLGVVRQETQQLIGLLSIRYTDVSRQQAHLDLVLRTDQHRQGLGTEALVAALSFCFAGIGLHRVTAECDPRNLGAVKLLERVGMQREGVARQSRIVQEEWADVANYAILKEELPPLSTAR